MNFKTHRTEEAMGVSKGIRRQIFAAMIANSAVGFFAWDGAWANVNFLHLQDPSTKFPGGPISKEQAALMVSLGCIGSLIANITLLWTLEKFGRKPTVLLLGPMGIIGWTLVIFAKNIYWLYLSRLIFGFIGGGMDMAIPIFETEICSDSIRGMVNSFGHVAFTIGILCELTISIFVDYRVQAMCGLVVPCFFTIIFYFIPETPVFLLNKNKIQAAEKSSKFYKGTERIPETTKFLHEKSREEPTTKLKLYDFFGTRASRKAIFIAFTLSYIRQLCGLLIVMQYSTAIFAELGSTWTPIQSSIIVAIAQLPANILPVFLIDRLGRKVLLITSALCASLGYLIVAFHKLYRDEFPNSDWIPICILSFTILIATMGIKGTPNVIIVDILPPKIRTVTMSLISTSTFLLAFAINIAYHHLLQTIQLHGCFMIFAGSCVAVASFTLVFVPETKGKSHAQIKQLLEK